VPGKERWVKKERGKKRDLLREEWKGGLPKIRVEPEREKRKKIPFLVIELIQEKGTETAQQRPLHVGGRNQNNSLPSLKGKEEGQNSTNKEIRQWGEEGGGKRDDVANLQNTARERKVRGKSRGDNEDHERESGMRR